MTPAARLRVRATRRFYRLLYALYRALFPTRVPAGPVDPARVRRLLVARTDRLGDLVVLTPTLSYLRARLPGAEIDVLAGPANASLLAGDPRVRRVYVHEPTWRGWLRSVRTLRARRYDVVFSTRLRDHGAEGLFAALVAGRNGVRLTGRRPPEFAGFFTHRVRVPRGRAHVVARLLYLARSVFGDRPAPPVAADLAQFPPALRVDPAAAARVGARVAALTGGGAYVALNAWGRDPRRSFPAAYAGELAAALAGRCAGAAVVLTPPPGREGEAGAIAAAARALGAPRVGVAPPSPDLADLVALLRGAAVVVTPDTANVHLASALGVPLVAVYTPLAVAEREWGAWGPLVRVVRLDEPRPLSDVPADEVARACEALWPAAGGAGRDAAAPAGAAAPRALEPAR